MPVLDRESFFNRVQEIVGTSTDDASIKFVEDMTDTYNDMESRLNGDGVDWQQRYNDLDKSWREKYRHRFFSGGAVNAGYQMPTQQEEREKEVTIDDLFK